MSFTVEDGTGLPDANSYVAVEIADAYHADQGNTAWRGYDSAKQTSLVRATIFVDATYRGRFPGYPATGRQQAREWPRIGAYVTIPDNGRSDAFFYGARRDYAFLNGVYYISANEIPREIVAATCEAALRELTDPGSLAPDLERGNAIARLKAGPVEIAYAGAAPATTVFQSLDLVLASLLMPGNPFGARVARG